MKIHPVGKVTPGSPDKDRDGEQSTDSLETIYKNYRVLKELPTSVLKRLVGTLL